MLSTTNLATNQGAKAFPASVQSHRADICLYAIIDDEGYLKHIGHLQRNTAQSRIAIREKKYKGTLHIFTDYGPNHSKMISLRASMKRGSEQQLTKVIGRDVMIKPEVIVPQVKDEPIKKVKVSKVKRVKVVFD